MPRRVLLTMVGLVVGCLGVVGAAWALDSEIYLFLMRPNFSFRVLPPPTAPWLVLAFFGCCLFVGFLSRHNGLVPSLLAT
jgi:hypothetical protein